VTNKPNQQGAILVLSGPSGAGKSTILNTATPHIGAFYFSISTTTRMPREGEQHGKEYYFVSQAQFEADIEAGNFLEYAKVHDNYYGTSLRPVKEALNEGKLVIFDIDVQGHRLVRATLGEIVTSVFITPPSLLELGHRLLNRSSDNQEMISKRLHNAKEEIFALNEYDYLILNDTIAEATEALIAVAKSARLKQSHAYRQQFIHHWLFH